MAVGYKMVRLDGTSFYDGKTRYSVGEVVVCDGSLGGSCGVGLHLGRRRHDPLRYNARWPCKLLECSYDESDVLGQDEYKVRVRKLRVIRELEPWDVDLPNAKRVYNIVVRAAALGPGDARIDRHKITQLLKEHCKRLSAYDSRHQIIEIKDIKYYTMKEWASVWASVQDSVRASVRASVQDSVWASVWASVQDSLRASVLASVLASGWASGWASVQDSVQDSVWASVLQEDEANYGLPLLEILENGGIFYGVDKNGTAHVILIGKNE